MKILRMPVFCMLKDEGYMLLKFSKMKISFQSLYKIKIRETPVKILKKSNTNSCAVGMPVRFDIMFSLLTLYGSG